MDRQTDRLELRGQDAMHVPHLCSSNSSFGSSHMGPKEAMAAGTSSHHTLSPRL